MTVNSYDEEEHVGCLFLIFFVYNVEARIKTNTQNIQQGEQETRGGGRGKYKAVGNRDMKRSVEGRGMGWGTRGKQDGHYRDFQEGKQGM